MKRSNKESNPGSLNWHIDNYRGPLYWLRLDGLDSVPDLLLSHRNTRIHRFADSELDHLRVSDLAQESMVWLLEARTIGAAILDSLEKDDFPVSRDPVPDPITEDWFVAQTFLPPSPGDLDFDRDLSHPSRPRH